MNYQPNTYFPSKTDPLLYYSDASLKSSDTLERYKECISNNKIDDGLAIVQHDSKLHYFSANLINKFEKQLQKLQEYYLEKEYVNPMIHGKNAPEDTGVHFIWIEEE